MKKIVLILLITMPFFCFAQQNDTIIKNTPTKETVNKNEYFEQLSALTKKSILSSQIEPMMIFINDIPLKEGVSTMVAIEDITNIHIIIDKDSLIQYGDKAKYGITKYTVSDVNKYAQYLDIPEE